MISLAANFNCDPLSRPLGFWAAKLGWTDPVRCAPYNQILQQLADPSGLFLASANRASVVLVRHEDWARFAGAGSGVTLSPEHAPLLRARNRELIEAIERATKQSAAPMIVITCPASTAVTADASAVELFRGLDLELARSFAHRSQITVISGDELVTQYACASIDSPGTDRVGHVPYTQEWFAVLATAIARTLFALRSAPRKVIVLDCDHTLWTGVLGEDGVAGVTLEPARRALQEFMVSQQQRGALLCLCSKNNEQDVWELFDQRPDMILRREHLVAWRINWRPKSANIMDLAAELGLGLDSFVFIDDDSLQCAEVRASCPEVATIQLPARLEEIPRFLDHLWVFDRPHVTAEDRERTRMYQVERAREDARKTSSSLGEFLTSLELKTEIQPPTDAELPRLSQLTQRTNQFNLTTIRRSEPELRELAADPLNVCLSVRVSDRFGDYGLVGLVLARRLGDRLEVDTLLMSCRVLGRGVEHRIVARLGQLALEEGLGLVEVRFRPTPRNIPAREFVEAALGDHGRDGTGGERVFVLPATDAAKVELRPDSAPVAAPREESRTTATTSATVSSELICAIAERRSGALLHDWMTVATAFTIGDEYRDATEVALAKIVAEQLGVDHISRDADFYGLGGDSLKALQALARIGEVLGVELSVDVLLEPTLSVATLAHWVEQARAK